MLLERNDVEKVAHLARLAINDQDTPDHIANLSKILDLIEQMNAVDTTDVTPMAHPLNIDQPLRQDQVTETDQREAFQTIAPKVESGLYIVPQVIE